MRKTAKAVCRVDEISSIYRESEDDFGWDGSRVDGAEVKSRANWPVPRKRKELYTERDRLCSAWSKRPEVKLLRRNDFSDWSFPCRLLGAELTAVQYHGESSRSTPSLSKIDVSMPSDVVVFQYARLSDDW